MNSNSCFGVGITSTSCPCKSGYHVPTRAEWDFLETILGCTGKLTGDSTGWECTANTSDAVNGLGWTSNNVNSLRKQLALTLGGYCSGGTCYYRGYYGNYWSTSVYTPNPAYTWNWYLSYAHTSTNRSYSAQTLAFPVRCLKD